MDSWEIQFSPSATEGTLNCHAGNSGTSCCCTVFAVCSLSRSPVCTCAGAALGERWRGVLILLFLFNEGAVSQSGSQPTSTAPTRTDAAQVRQAAAAGSSDTNGSAGESFCSGNCQWVNWDNSPFSTGERWRCHSSSLPWWLSRCLQLASVC